MNIIFDEIAHTYTDDRSGEQLTPVNYLINQVYGSGYEYVKKSILEARANRGRAIHLDAHNWMTRDGYYGMKHIETRALVGWLERNDISLKAIESEKIVSVSGMFAGTADLVTGSVRKAHLWDYKTNLNKPTKKMLSHWQMQLSFYKYALEKMGYNVEKMTILHLSGTKCTPYELEYLGDKFVEETMQAYKEGRKLYNNDKMIANVPQVSKRAIGKLERTLKKIAALEKEIAPIREQIKSEMEKRGIMAINTQGVSITYVAPHKSKKLDTKRLKAENEDLCEKYTIETEVEGHIRITTNEKA